MRPALRLLIFPTTWFAGLVIDFLFTHFRSTPEISEESTFFSAFFVFAVAVAWGAVCLIVTQVILRDPGTTRSLMWPLELVGLIASIVLGPLIAAGSTSAVTYDPIGVGNDADVDGAPCKPTDVAQLADDGEHVATIREVHCEGGWDEPSTYFVFVHKIGNAPMRQDLVLRYVGDWEGAQWGEAPNVMWLGNASLSIKGGGKIEQITEQQSRVHAIDIEYALTPPVCPPVYNPLERLLWNWFRLFALCEWMG